MATYVELNQLLRDDDLRGRVKIACMIAAEAIRTESGATPNHANRVLWARRVLMQPDAVAGEMLGAVLAANAAATMAQIQGASDATVQAKVAAAVDLFTV